jgi:small subunit ribosomal protein S21
MNNEKSLVTVYVKNGDINKALKIFKKRTFESGHLLELRDRKEFTKPTTKRRKQKKDAIRRQNFVTMLEKISDGDTTIKVPEKKVKNKK